MTLWHTSGVPAAVGQVRAANSLLVVLTTHVLGNGEKGAEALSTVSSRALESTTFGSAAALDALKRHQAVCLKMRGAADDPDFVNFSALFPVPHTPCVHIVAPDGRVLLQRPFFTSPNALVAALEYAAKARDAPPDNQPTLPQLGPALHAPRPLSEKTLARLKAQREAAEREAQIAAKRAADALEKSRKAAAGTAKRAGGVQTVERTLPASQGALQLGERARLQLRLSDGRTPSRSFGVDATLRDVCAWAAEESGLGNAPDRVRLSVSFPRRVFDAADNPKTLRELGLVPSATLIVSTVETAIGMASGLVSSGSAFLRGAVGVAGSFLGSFVGAGPAPSDEAATRNGEANERERGRNQRT